MPVPKKLGGMKRFGARYGRSLKQRYVEIEVLHRAKYKCPYCASQGVKRVALGIWQCRKCDAKFASRAHTVAKKKTAKELAAEVIAAEKIGAETKETIESWEDVVEKIPS